MPIEIKELHIRIAVTSSATATAAAAGTAGGGDAAKEAMVAECVEQVMTILQDKAER